MTPDSVVAQASRPAASTSRSTSVNLDFHRRYVARVCAILGLESEFDLSRYALDRRRKTERRRLALLAIQHRDLYFIDLTDDRRRVVLECELRDDVQRPSFWAIAEAQRHEREQQELLENARRLGVRSSTDLVHLLANAVGKEELLSACSLAKQMSDEKAAPELFRILGEEQDEWVVWVAAEALQDIPGEEITEGLLAFLAPATEEMRCKAVAQAFWWRELRFNVNLRGYRTDPRVGAALIDVLEDEDREVYTRDRAAEALGSAAARDSDRAIEALCKASRHPSVWIRMGALCGLSQWLHEDAEGNPPDPRAVQAYRDRKDDQEAIPGAEPICEYFRYDFGDLPD